MSKYAIIISLFLLFVNVYKSDMIYSQERSDMYIAQYYFIEGKTLDIQGDYAGAIENYLKAVKFENSGGIRYAIAKAYFNLDRLKEAMMELSKAITLNPDNIDYQILKANILIISGNTQPAVEIFEKLLEKYPENVQVAYSLARIYEDIKMPSKAITIYEKITDFYGFDYEVLRRMYEIYFSYKNYSKCLETIQYLLKLDPYDFEYQMRLAALYRLTDKDKEAFNLYSDLYKINPGNKDIQTELIKLYFLYNEPEKGFELFSAVIGKEKLGFEEKLQMGEIYYNLIESDKQASAIARTIFFSLLQEYPEKWQPYFYIGAIDISENKNTYYQWFDSAFAKADTSVEAYAQISYSYFNRSNYDRAIETALKGLQYSNDNFQLNYIYGLCMQRTGKLEDAVRYYETALEKNPNDLSLLSTLGLAYNSLQKFEDSDRMYEKALKIEPDNALILNNYAYNLAQRGKNLEKAMKMSRKSIEKEPKNPNYLDTFGWIYYKMGEYKEAEKYIKQSLEVNSGSAVVQEHLGDVYSGMKDCIKALSQYKKAIELNPDSEALKQKIEKLAKPGGC